MSEQDIEQRLTSALVAGHERLYLQDAGFKHTVDLLVRLLPFWVTGLAEQAQKEAVGRQALMEEQMRARPLFTGPGDHERLLKDLGFHRDVDGLIIEPGSDPLA